MKIVWEEPKRLANIQKHGFDPADAVFFGWETAVIDEARPARDGRKRRKAIGNLWGEVVTIIYSPLGSEALSIISLRSASAKERRLLNA